MRKYESASSLSKYHYCQLYYANKYIYKIPESITTEQKIRMARGSLEHELINLYMTDPNNKKFWIKMAILKREYGKSAQRDMYASFGFIEKNSIPGWINRISEHKFYMTIGYLDMQVIPDCIYEYGNLVIIDDYKTGMSEYAGLDIQSEVYMIWAKRFFNKKVLFRFISPRTKKIVVINENDLHNGCLANIMCDLKESWNSDIFKRTGVCSSCTEYREYCNNVNHTVERFIKKDTNNV